jgi:uncharacterized UBP type Zn finger protein
MERTSRDPINPANFQRALGRKAPQFANRRQQDAHELLGALLNLLDSEWKATHQKEDKEASEYWFLPS